MVNETGSGKPDHGYAPRARQIVLDPLRELPYGPAAYDSRNRGRTHVSTRPRSALFEKILLAPTGASTHDDDVTGLEGWGENLVDIELETLAVDRSVDQPWCIDTVVAQCRQEGHGLPMTVRHLGLDPLAARRPSSERRHIGLGPGLVDEHQAGRIDAVLMLCPLDPPARHIGAILLTGDQRLFCD